jgi:uncharacterized membrane protein YqiK
MDMSNLTYSIGGLILIGIFVLVGIMFLLTRFLRKVEPGKAMLIIKPLKAGPNAVEVRFTGGLVIPFLHKVEVMDISTKKITVERRGQEGLICADNVRADISVNFYVRVNNTEQDVKQVAQSIGVERASAMETLNELFQAKFAEALKTVGKQMNFEDLFKERTSFKERIMQTIGENLNGYSLEDTAIDYLEQTPVEMLDPNNIMDAEGIRKIFEITLTKKESKEKRETEAKERILELEKQRAEAEAKNQAEIKIIQAREQAEATRVSEEERFKAEAARIKTEEQLAVATANKERQVEVALKNRDKTIAVEEERVERDRQLEATEREKLVALASIAKEKAVEQERKEIQDIIRQRVAVERSVAEEEERTKDTRATAAANRNKIVAITEAEAEAERLLVVEIKSAEAKEKAATHIAQEKGIMAQAELDISEKLALSKKKLAEGVIAEESARGLAHVKVKEADAEAIKKVGEAEAVALRHKVSAEAEGAKEKGFADVEVKKAEAVAYLQTSEAEATSKQRLADADAHALQVKFEAEAKGIEHKGNAESIAIKEKAEAMKEFDGVGREHEEFKLRLAMREKLAMEEMQINRDIAQSNAKVVATALGNAKIDIVGGETQFFDKILGSIANGKAGNAYFDHHKPMKDFKDALLQSGEKNLLRRISTLAGEVGVSSETVKNLSLSALLAKMAKSTKDESLLTEIETLSAAVEDAGISLRRAG